MAPIERVRSHPHGVIAVACLCALFPARAGKKGLAAMKWVLITQGRKFFCPCRRPDPPLDPPLVRGAADAP